MIAVQVEWGFAAAIYRREYPEFPVDVGRVRFSDFGGDAAAWFVALLYVDHAFQTKAPKERRILVVTEPQAYLPDAYVNQFGILISPFLPGSFRGVWVPSHPALPTFLGLEFAGKDWHTTLTYQELEALEVPTKTDAISAVVSKKSVLPGHRRRLRFLRNLKDSLGSRIVVYGRGVNEVRNKSQAILPFRFHLVLENTVMPSYWTEKLADAWLGYAFPIVSGAPDLWRWFPVDSFVSIDIDKPAEAAETIRRVMNEGITAQRFAAICEARRRILADERLCPLVARVIEAHPSDAPPLATAETIVPPPRPSIFGRAAREIRRMWWQARTAIDA